jgi:hypothetical protein
MGLGHSGDHVLSGDRVSDAFALISPNSPIRSTQAWLRALFQEHDERHDGPRGRRLHP